MIALRILDTDGKRIETPMFVEAFIGARSFDVAPIDEPTELVKLDLPEVSNGVVRVRARAESYRAVGRVLRLREKSVTLILPVDPSKARPVFDKPPLGLDRVVSEDSELEDERRAGLWNLWAKICAESIQEALCLDEMILDQGIELAGVQQDRLYARTSPDLSRRLHEFQRAKLGWDDALSQWHREPPGYTTVGCFKSDDHYGNLQIVVFGNEKDLTHQVAEFDIDDAKGIEHVFQVIRNKLWKGATHPYDIREILVRHQDVRPGYRLEVAT